MTHLNKNTSCFNLGKKGFSPAPQIKLELRFNGSNRYLFGNHNCQISKEMNGAVSIITRDRRNLLFSAESYLIWLSKIQIWYTTRNINNKCNVYIDKSIKYGIWGDLFCVCAVQGTRALFGRRTIISAAMNYLTKQVQHSGTINYRAYLIL